MTAPSRLGWTNRRVVLILVAGLLVEQAWGDDVLSRSQQVGDALRGHVHRAVVRMAVSQATPWFALEALRQSVAIAPPEGVHIVAEDGRILASVPALLVVPQPVRERIVNEPMGVGTYHSFTDDFSDVVRRDLGWSRQTIADQEWIVVVERERPLVRVSEEPLTGRWMGAYSYAGFRAGEAPSPKEAGPMSVLILQEGDRCQVHAVSQRFNLFCAGLVSGTNLTAGADSSPGQPTVILDAGYCPIEDKIRGTLHLVGGNMAGRATVFLQRAPES